MSDEQKEEFKAALKFKEVEATKINLIEGDVLMVTVKSDDANPESLTLLNDILKEMFPNNRIMVFGMGLNDEVKFTIANRDEADYNKKVSEEAPKTEGESNG